MHSADEQIDLSTNMADKLKIDPETKKLRIHLEVAGRRYGFDIDRSKEEFYRKAEHEVNRSITAIESKFNVDHEQSLAMTAIRLALENSVLAASRSLDDDMESLERLDRKLEAYFAKLN